MSVGIRAAGGVVRRRGASGPQVALVHRPRYNDWTLPKGKAIDGETDEATALREVEEETGLRCELGAEVAEVSYTDHLDRPKTVRYFMMYATNGSFIPNDEVDWLWWVSGEGAAASLTYEHDRDVVRRALAFDRPIYLVRHAKAGSRDAWTEDDRLRPLSKSGRRQAEALVDLLAGRRLERVLSSPYDRCVQTVRPLAISRRLPIEETEILAEGAPLDEVVELLRGLCGAAVLCSHGDLIPEIVLLLSERGVELRDPPAWKKGSTWILERDGGLFMAASYLPPPPPPPPSMPQPSPSPSPAPVSPSST